MSKHRIVFVLATLLLVSVRGQVLAKEGGVFTAGDLWESYLTSGGSQP